MTPARVIRFDDLEPRPWRNGLGVTRTIRAMSAGGGWALSIATLEGTAEFSVIPATQRVQLAIDAVRLVIDGTEVALGHGEQTQFTGEQRVTGASAAGSSRVLNLMYDQAGPGFQVSVVNDASEIPEGALAVVVLDGAVEAHGSPLRHLDAILLASDSREHGLVGAGGLAVVRQIS